MHPNSWTKTNRGGAVQIVLGGFDCCSVLHNPQRSEPNDYQKSDQRYRYQHQKSG